MAGITLDVLGPTQVTSDGGATTLRPRERDVLAALALRHPQPVSLIELSGLLWNVAPASDLKTLQNHVARVRRALGADAVVTTGSSYSLGAQVRLDLVEFHEARASAVRAASVGDHRGAHLHFERALRQVRGEPFADLEATNAVAVARRTLEQAIGEAADSNLLALMDAGDTDTALATAQQLVIGVRERRALLVSLAYYRAGRRLDALRALHGCRQALRDAGLTLGEPLVRMEQALLSDDPALFANDATSVTRGSMAAAPTTGAPVLVGRDAVLARLHTLVTTRFDAAGSGPAVVALGARGVGTSAVSARVALQARLAGWTVLETVRLPAADVLATIEMTAERPLLVVVDGTDAYTDDDWRRIAFESGPRSCVVATARVAPAEGLAHSVCIEPLARASVEQLVELTVGAARGALQQDFVDAVVEGSGGLPGLVMELAIEGAHQSDASSVARRLVDGLSELAAQVATIVAAAAGPVSVGQVLAVAARLQAHATEREVADCLSRRVLAEQPGHLLACRDAAARAVLLTDADHRWLRAAREAWIAEFDVAGDAHLAVADLLVELPDWPADDAIARFDQAVETAMARIDHEGATLNAGRALRLVAAQWGPDHPLVLRREIDLSWFRKDAANAAYSDVHWQLVDRLTALDDHTNLVRLVGMMALMRPSMESEPPPAFVELIDRALALPADPVVRAEAASAVTDVFSLSDVERCRKYAELSYELANLVDDDEMRLEGFDGLSVALGHPSTWPRRAALALEATSIAERTGNPRRRANVMQQTFSTQLQHADPLCRASLDRMELFGTRYEMGSLRFIHGYLQAALWHVENRLDDCMEVLADLGNRLPIAASRLDAIVTSQEVGVRWAQGRLPELGDRVDHLSREQPGFGLWHGVRCWVTAAAGDERRCVESLAAVGDGATLPHTMAWAGAAYAVARASAQFGDHRSRERIHALLAPHTGLMAWYGNGVYGPIDLALAELDMAMGRAEQAAEHLAVAERLVRQLYAPVFVPELVALRARLG
jgi:DNA-binding SARP family transcriptional activator